MRLTLQQLKQEAQELWELLNMADNIVPTPGQFHQDVRRYGKESDKTDLRYRQVWENACIQLEVLSLLKSGTENTDLVLYLYQPDTPIGQAYRDRIIEAVLCHSSGLNRIKDGLERLYHQPASSSDAENAVSFAKQLASRQQLQSIIPALPIAS